MAAGATGTVATAVTTQILADNLQVVALLHHPATSNKMYFRHKKKQCCGAGAGGAEIICGTGAGPLLAISTPAPRLGS